jgi:hypothetical protein
MTEKKPYILKRDFPPLEPVIKRLQAFVDYQLSLEGEMYRALMKEGISYGHGGNGNGDERIHQRNRSSHCESAVTDEASQEGFE